MVAVELRRARIDAGLEQTTLASRADVKRSTISNIENCRQATTLELFYKLASGLGKNPGEFFNSIISKAVPNRSLTIEDVGHDHDIYHAVTTTISKGV